MKHLHFDVELNGFYGAYWACAGGSDCAVITMIGDDPGGSACALGSEMALRVRCKRAHNVAREKKITDIIITRLSVWRRQFHG